MQSWAPATDAGAHPAASETAWGEKRDALLNSFTTARRPAPLRTRPARAPRVGRSGRRRSAGAGAWPPRPGPGARAAGSGPGACRSSAACFRLSAPPPRAPSRAAGRSAAASKICWSASQSRRRARAAAPWLLSLAGRAGRRPPAAGPGSTSAATSRGSSVDIQPLRGDREQHGLFSASSARSTARATRRPSASGKRASSPPHSASVCAEHSLASPKARAHRRSSAHSDARRAAGPSSRFSSRAAASASARAPRHGRRPRPGRPGAAAPRP